MVFFRKFLVLMLAFMMYISIAKAAAFDVETAAVVDKISIEEFAKFQIKIKNNIAQNDEYRIYTANFPTWDVRTEPIVNPITLSLKPGEEGSVEVLVDPLKIKDIGTYAVNLNVRSAALNELKTVPVEVTILSTSGLIQGYAPTVITSVGIPEKIDPREEVKVKIVLNNQNVIDYEDIEIRLESNVISETFATSLGPREEKTLELALNLDPLTKPQMDRFAVSLYTAGKSIINPIVRDVEIIEYADAEIVEEKKSFLSTKKRYNLVSNNPSYDGPFRIEATLLDSVFSSESPNARPVKEDGKRYIEWNIKLDGNIVEASVTKNFLPTFVVIIVVVGLVFAYFSFRSPLQIRKESSNVVKKEGGISEMSVILHIKNRGQAKITDIDITETIPSIVSIERDVSIGSLQPNKVLRHEKKGTTIVKWIVDSLDPAEERVLSYKIKTKLSILGSFSLPVAAASFKFNGKAFTSTSNRLNIDG